MGSNAKRVMVTCALILLTTPALADRGPDKPRYLAIKMHADWCASCRQMSTIVADLEGRLDGEPVLVLQLDLTNRSTRARSAMLASALGLDSVWRDFSDTTGKVLLVNARTKRVEAQFGKTQCVKAISADIRSRL